MKVLLAIVCRSPVVVLLMLLLTQPSLAQFHGKIFTTPEERAYLDALRDDFLRKSRNQGFDINDAGPPPLPEPKEEPAETATLVEYTLGGILTRNDGSRTVWLNSRPVAETDLPANMRLAFNGQLAVLQIKTSAGNFQLKPGQTLNSSTGEIQEAYQRMRPPLGNVREPDLSGDKEAEVPSNQSASDPAEILPASNAAETDEADRSAAP